MGKTFENKILIEMIRRNPVLYDQSHANYKNVRIKDKIWNEIADTLGETDCGEEIKRRWKNLRDSFSKHVRSETAGSGKGKEAKFLDRYKSWPWAKHMEFLRPYLTRSDSTQSTPATDDSELCPVWTEEDEFLSEPSSLNVPKKMEIEEDEEPLQESNSEIRTIISYLEERRRNARDVDDVDLLFQGYAKTVKKLAPKRQIMIKFKISQMLMEEELAELEEMEQSVYE
ncbi:unnamed protein product [Acanthoscelides obtectus]|uniref:MADF domain-containing protein n=1 Tax=Acanthoscelides obtectus TaxID=200917 RepID=A0A9P0KY86_ACAOB|nr:unnamed protein product [Acanthoscelides obtectus]CAK1676846.1 Transcription factor Adf-1 [Acanthoscelides obtectus]